MSEEKVSENIILLIIAIKVAAILVLFFAGVNCGEYLQQYRATPSAGVLLYAFLHLMIGIAACCLLAGYFEYAGIFGVVAVVIWGITLLNPAMI